MSTGTDDFMWLLLLLLLLLPLLLLLLFFLDAAALTSLFILPEMKVAVALLAIDFS